MRSRTKICGIRTEAALDAALAGGAACFGLVFYPPSPRTVDVETAARLAAAGRRSGAIQSVALLVDPDDALVDLVSSKVSPDMLQLHGQETVARVREIRKRSQRPVMKAVAVRTHEDVAAALAYYEPLHVADLILFDAMPPPDAVLPGGNGLAFDWQILDAVRGRMPFALAGGLTPDNVAAAIRLTGADLVDVSSGVESSPGEKDTGLIRRFLEEASSANESA
jgi:phosphoribosylanthranilate isomerase